MREDFADVAAPDAQRAIHHRRIVEDENLLAAGRAVFREDFDCDSVSRSASSPGLAMVAEQQMNCGDAAVEARDAAQPAQHIAQVAAEDAAIGVQLVQHDVAQILEQARPAGVVRQDAGVQHVRIGQHDVPLFADGRARVGGRVAVVGENAESVIQALVEIVELGELILRQRLGGKKIQRARVGIFQHGVQDRQVVAERLAGSGRRDDDHFVARHARFRGLGLVCVRPPNALCRIGCDQFSMHPTGKSAHCASRAGKWRTAVMCSPVGSRSTKAFTTPKVRAMEVVGSSAVETAME